MRLIDGTLAVEGVTTQPKDKKEDVLPRDRLVVNGEVLDAVKQEFDRPFFLQFRDDMKDINPVFPRLIYRTVCYKGFCLML